VKAALPRDPNRQRLKGLTDGNADRDENGKETDENNPRVLFKKCHDAKLSRSQTRCYRIAC